MRVGLVLGAGGVIGGSWLMGALEALEAGAGWGGARAAQNRGPPGGARPRRRRGAGGAPAGAATGAPAAAGVPPEYMSAYAAGQVLDDLAEAEERAAATAQRAS